MSIAYLGCTEKTKNISKKIISKNYSYQILNNETTDSNNLNEYINQIKLKKSSVIGNFEVKYGYLENDEDKNEWKNLGFLEVYKNLKLIYQEKFKGYDELFIHNLGHHLLYKNKIIFKLDYGTEACDYAHSSRYYYISEND